MNFLAHLHIASVTQTSSLGNFLGDFVKGNPDTQFDSAVVQGIRLHRFVDSCTDHHPLIKALKPLFPTHLRRFSPITLDMFWDHCLAKHWSEFESVSLADFCAQAQLQVESESRLETNPIPERFTRISSMVWKDKWLESYQKIENIDFALKRMATRSPRMAPLGETGDALIAHYEALTEQFFLLYPDVLKESVQFVAETKSKKETVKSPFKII